MNFKNLKFGLPRFSLKKSLFAEPAVYWNSFLWFLIIFLLVVFAFDAWVFWKVGVKEDGEIVPPGADFIKVEELDILLQKIEQKKNNFENYKSGFQIEAPS